MKNYKRIPCTNALDVPSIIHQVSDEIYISESLIPYDRETATLVFFVSANNGDEYGQFPTLELALETAKSI